MYSISLAALSASGLMAVSAAPTAHSANPFNLTTPVCGPSVSDGNGVCIDANAINSKAHATYASDSKHYLFTQFLRKISEGDSGRWQQCTAACHASGKCASIAYYNQGPGLEAGGALWVCQLFSVPIAPYAIKCGDSKYGPGATPFAQQNSAIGDVFNPASQNVSALSNYFDKSCPSDTLKMKTSGSVPAATSDDLLCGVYTTTQQSYADLFLSAPNNTQAACRAKCLGTKLCKSYWWQMFSEPTAQPFGLSQTSEPEVNGDCALFSQPIKEHGMFSEFPLPIFDVNCNLGNGTF